MSLVGLFLLLVAGLGLAAPAVAPRSAAPAARPAEGWAEVIARVTPAVVSIRMDRRVPFDTDGAGNSYATGFVVDAERGILLTNRHVVGAGPTRAEAIFITDEEVPLTLLYRDPVHDFGFFRFDPAAVRFAPLVALPLRPEAAQVGLDVRVIGNDAGEKVSILSGTIARLDRPAPDYGAGRFNDFNTFYIQAASGTSGGSSGSPVIGPDGAVVALNAGSNRTSASSFFLPLDRVVRALAVLQAGGLPSRGTLQVTWQQRSWDELRRLGLDAAEEATYRGRSAGGNGLLVVDEVLPGGPADGLLQAGDVLLSAEGKDINTFVDLEAILDDSTHADVRLAVLRGGEPLTVALRVGDLHQITPQSWVEAGGAVFHPLSYQKARGFSVPVQGVFVADRGYLLEGSAVPAGALLRAVNGVPVADLEALWAALGGLADREPLTLRYSLLSEPGRELTATARMDRRWHPLQRCAFDASSGAWPCEQAGPPPAPKPPALGRALTVPADGRAARRLASGLVMVHFTVPMAVDSVSGRTFAGAGLVVDGERGWVLVDRDTVPVALGDASVTFGGGFTVPARVRWLHPTENFALLSYEPEQLIENNVKQVKLDGRPLKRGQKVTVVGLDRSQQVVWRATEVEAVKPWAIGAPRPPAWTPTNFEIVDLQDAVSSSGGAVVDRRGRVRASWASYVDRSGKELSSWFAGLPSAVLIEGLEQAQRAEGAPLFVPAALLDTLDLKSARELGLSEARVAALLSARPARLEVLQVSRVSAGSPAAEALKVGDLIIELEGALGPTGQQVDTACLAGRPLQLRLLRDGAELDVALQPQPRDVLGPARVLRWAGALLQDTPPAVADQRSAGPSADPRGGAPVGVYVSAVDGGSPASRYKLRSGLRITAINDVPVHTLADFMAAMGAQGTARLRVVELDGRVAVLTLKPDPLGWPTTLVERGPEGWTSSTP